MKHVVRKSLKKWLLLSLGALIAYGSGTLTGRFVKNRQTPPRKTLIMDAGEKAGGGVGR